MISESMDPEEELGWTIRRLCLSAGWVLSTPGGMLDNREVPFFLIGDPAVIDMVTPILAEQLGIRMTISEAKPDSDFN